LAEKKKKQTNNKSRPFPDRQDVINYIQKSPTPPTKREIARYFKIRGDRNKIKLKELLGEFRSLGFLDAEPDKASSNNRAAKYEGSEEITSLVGFVQSTDMGLRFISSSRKVKIAFEIKGAKSFNHEKIGVAFQAEVISTDPPIVELGQEIGPVSDVSLLSSMLAGLPTEFPKDVIEESKKVSVIPDLGKREDIRKIPLITIDGKDSRDFDDAVFAEKTKDGWHIIVAIADVSYYVRPGSALDKTALERGNSTYFPDRVIPMLPENLSNGICSLNPDEDRACMGVHIWINDQGKKKEHKFFRGLMRSHARTTYEQVQKAYESGQKDLKPVVEPLFGAFHALENARKKRGTLEIEVPEPYIIFDEEGFVKELVPRSRLDTHKLIEEFMVLANVAAAEQLEQNKQLCMYRIHDKPDHEKVEEIRKLLTRLKIKYEGSLKVSQDFTQLIKQVHDTSYRDVVNELILRSQSQAVYSSDNIGHFGLNLEHYAHFTSPIRRYSDLMVHRALLKTIGISDGALPPISKDDFQEVARYISTTERRSVGAERDAMDRYMTQFLSNREGDEFDVYVTGISTAGLFVTIPEFNASGLVPARTLSDDYYILKDHPTRLEGRKTKRKFSFGDPMRVFLSSADLTKGRLTFEPTAGMFSKQTRYNQSPGPKHKKRR